MTKTTKMTKAQVLSAFKTYWGTLVRHFPNLSNDEPAKREAFSRHIDQLHRAGRISDRLADTITLD